LLANTAANCHLVTSQSDRGTVVGAPTFTAIASDSSTSVQVTGRFF
jgi:hypothetical protein